MPSDCLRSFVRCPHQSAHLICFPAAGAAASDFRAFGELLAPTIAVSAVQYPGRQDRYGDRFAPDIATLADEVAGSIEPWLDGSAALFGHSMGATVAFEVARRLRPRYPTPLRRLFVSARRDPSAPRPFRRELREHEIRAYVGELGGDDQLLENDDLWRVTLPILRADLRLADHYRFHAGAPLTCPITAIVGSQDTSVTLADAQRWADHTIGPFEAHVLPGGHFYLAERPGPIVAILAEALVGPGGAGPGGEQP